ncbi:DNA-binding protein [Hyphopichia burtonii NRRL Y-1933]|uniref:DNA-binding protein n=1 Tax=Hyphopichia burtonii NRRL Y-1933 TaxID=984485 RepID=A0A1E4RL86_9ASCO|nr:DNA-binding protein [Hyphopichia burtonii NRRL Y-1933]ODV67875.1 DNA-binding protein [Hyphopichia burtonii NRRL Y-1933]
MTTNPADNTSLSKLALKGSSKIVADYFEFAINNILFQRGIYPAEDFITVKKYDLPLLVTADEEVKDYIRNIMTQVKKWIYGGKIIKLVVVIINKSTTDIVERWEFAIEIFKNDGQSSDTTDSKPKELIQKEIQSIIRQITASVSYLPFLKDDDYTFNVLVYTDPKYDTRNLPNEWADTNGDAKLVEGENVENVKFTSFSTNIHQVGTLVSYKLSE